MHAQMGCRAMCYYIRALGSGISLKPPDIYISYNKRAEKFTSKTPFPGSTYNMI